MRQPGDGQQCRPEGLEVHLHPAARWASETEEEEKEIERQRQWRRRIVVAHAKAIDQALSDATATATELWSPPRTPVRRRKSFRSATPPRSGLNPATTTCLDESTLVPSATIFPGPAAAMMDVNVVPSVVLHFHGLRSSLLSNLWDACYRILLDMAKRVIEATIGFMLLWIAFLVLKATMLCVLYWAAFALTTGGAFLALEAMAVMWAHKRSALLHHGVSESEQLSMSAIDGPVTRFTPTLPRLNVPAPVFMQPTASEAPTDEKVHRNKNDQDGEGESTAQHASLQFPTPSPQLLAVRRRIAQRLRAPPVIVNRVSGESRKRADVCLHEAKIRVGKAYIDRQLSAAVHDKYTKNKQQDIYMVRIDCSKPDDKHMNPVVMWDITATFEDFRKLEKDLRVEVKAKCLRNVTIPHLSSGSILFVQPKLDDHVLNVRRKRLQNFIDQVREDRVLADLDAMRKFCQAF